MSDVVCGTTLPAISGIFAVNVRWKRGTEGRTHLERTSKYLSGREFVAIEDDMNKHLEKYANFYSNFPHEGWFAQYGG